MDLQIAGETGLVLGGTRGLAFACARALVDAGVNVAVCGRRADVGAEAAKSLGGNAAFIACDLSVETARTHLIREVRQRFGDPSILVTNSGGPPTGAFAEVDLQAWRRSYEGNVLAMIEIARELIPAMVARGFGRIVNITSFVVKEPYPNMSLSNSVRVALTGAMASLAREVMDKGITVNNVLPGLMDTGALERVVQARASKENIAEDEVRRLMALSIPARRLGRAEDFGPLCAFLCSRRAGYITAQNICVDGGLVRGLL